MIQAILGRLAAGGDLSFDEMSHTIDAMMRGEIDDGQIALLLSALRAKGETVDEVAGAAFALRKHMTPIRTVRSGVLDTCGTGGFGSTIFNVSTAAALVAAAAGVPVAKHGNRSVTSRSGSADVLAALGVNVEAEAPRVEACLDRLGICFCFAPYWHRSMKQVAAVRKRLGVSTIFNLLGPLSNPARAEFQLLGVGKAELRPLMAQALARLGVTRALVVRGEDGIGEVTIACATDATEVNQAQLTELRWTPEDFGLSPSPLDSLEVTGAEQSAAIIRKVLSGTLGPPRDIVLLNAAAALWTAGKLRELTAAVKTAAEAVDSGAAADLLAQLVVETNR